MYKALELYPKKHKGVFEQLILTNAAARRLNRFWVWCRERYGTIAAASLAFCGNKDTLRIYYSPKRGIMDRSMCSIDVYLRMMRFKGTQLTRRDLNYAYANVIYPPEEIMRRVIRLSDKRRSGVHGAYGCAMVAAAINRSIPSVTQSLRYLKKRSALTYADAMMWIAKQEQLRGYPDSLSFEK